VPKLVYQLRQNRQNWHVVALRDTYSKLSAALKKAAELNKLPRVTRLSLGQSGPSSRTKPRGRLAARRKIGNENAGPILRSRRMDERLP
jgi:hypothetical protein